ncbi:MAG: hypothetical protein Q9198_006312 [Flavoplaca austrocitrina]
MESDGLPNAGLDDQRAVLQWIQDHIHLIGGDKTKASTWEESASIMHPLTAFGGSHHPLFSRAVVQSPAFQPKSDPKCAGEGLACLRAASVEVLDHANDNLNEGRLLSMFAVGPSADGS